MISAFLLLLCNSLFLSLHLSGGTGSFPKPLTAAQEREYLRRCAEGDTEPAGGAQPAAGGAHYEKDVV